VQCYVVGTAILTMRNKYAIIWLDLHTQRNLVWSRDRPQGCGFSMELYVQSSLVLSLYTSIPEKCICLESICKELMMYNNGGKMVNLCLCSRGPVCETCRCWSSFLNLLANAATWSCLRVRTVIYQTDIQWILHFFLAKNVRDVCNVLWVCVSRKGRTGGGGWAQLCMHRLKVTSREK